MKRAKKFILLLSIGCSAIGKYAEGNVYTVTNTFDSGAGSLRQAMIDANAHAGFDTIRFQILPVGNDFEGSAPNTYAVIEINSILPTITGSLFIDGSSQSNTNTGNTGSINVGVDNISLGSIPYPDVYLVPSASFPFPTNSTGVGGNGLTIDGPDVTIKGIAISGFGNTHTNGGTASGHADIALLRSSTSRTINVSITNCFLSCDPLGTFPVAAERKTKACGILVAGNNNIGTISNNYIAHSGTYAIHFNGNVDNLGVGPAATVGSRSWTIIGNQLLDAATNSTISSITRVSDGILLMKCVSFRISENYVDNAEQMGFDLGYNADSNYISNNTITNFVKTSAYLLQAGIRIGLCSESDTLFRNIISYNSASTFKGGVWIDKSYLNQPGVIVKDNINNLLQENVIHDNNGSAIVLSNYSGGPAGGCYNNTITRNSTYNNVGLGIDLDYSAFTGPTLVTVDDDGDGDAGPNNTQNFPILDSARKISDTLYAFYGKAPAGSLIEFFINDGQSNKHGGLTFNYGEGKTFIGSVVEGSAQDLRAGTGSYNIDGNIATNNNNLFFVILTYKGPIVSMDSITSTATIGKNTSEFGPVVNIYASLDCSIIGFSAAVDESDIKLNWRAISNNNFKYFDVEQSTNGISFTRLVTINAKDLDKVTDYEFVQTNAGPGKHYYRLRMVGTSEALKYSTIVSAEVRGRSLKELENMSSFFIDHIQLKITSEGNQDISLNLYNEQGKLVRSKAIHGNAGFNLLQLDNLENLSAGAYFLQLKREGQTIARKIIKQ